MKKILTTILIITTLAAMLTACSPNKTETKPDENNQPNTAEEKETVSDIKERTLRFGTTSADTSAVVDTMKKFKEIVAEKSGNKINVEIFSGSTLGDVKQMMQNAQLGAIDMCMTTPSSLVDNGAKKFTVLNLPYIFDGHNHSWNVLQGDVGQELLASVSEEGLKMVGIGYYKDGARNFFTSKKPIRSLEDIKGMKIRVQQNDMDTEMAKALGANPTPISFAELYSALQSGVVDGAENPTEGFYNGKYSEVCKYLTIDEHSNPPIVVLFSEMIWEQMSETEKEMISSAWKDAEEFNKQNVLKREDEIYLSLEAEGVEIIKIQDKEKWIEAMTPVYDKFGVEVSDLINRINALKK